MQKKKLNNQGFSLVAILSVVIVVALVGLSGWYVWHKNHDNKTKTSSTSTNKSTDSTSSNKSTTTKRTTDEAVSAVQSAYSTALAYVQQKSNADQGEIDAVKGYLDPSLYSRLTATEAQGADHDLILCSQAFPDSVTASLKSSTSDTATVSVAEVFGSTTKEVIATVNLITLKITNVTCAQ